jgi:hypothetical protein
MAGITGIGGEKFSGKPGDWPETKTEIIGWLEASGYSYIAKTGTILFHFAGSGDHDHLEDGDLERHYASKMWPGRIYARSCPKSPRALSGVRGVPESPCSSLSGTLVSYGASAVTRTSGRGHLTEAEPMSSK